MRQKRLIDSFNCAFEGLVYVIRSQRHMRYHLIVMSVVLVFALFSNPPFDVKELAILFLTITIVILAEMANTALEAVVDIASPEYSPLARIAKDVAAGGVLAATINAIITGYLLFFSRFKSMGPSLYHSVHKASLHIIVIGLILVTILVIAAKLITRRGTPMQGGVLSGHSATAIFLATSIFLLSHGEAEGMLVSAGAYFLAILVIQSRLETGVHTVREVIGGSLVGMIMSLALFKIFG